MDRLLLYLLCLLIFGGVTFTAQFGYMRLRDKEESVQKRRHSTLSRNCTALLAVPRHQAIFLHIGKAAGGTFLHRARHEWKLQIVECHPDPCGHDYFQQNSSSSESLTRATPTTAIVVSIRDPVDRFVSAFYWKIKTICTLHPHLCDANTATQQQQDLHRHRPSPPSAFSYSFSRSNNSSLQDDMEAMQRYILFEKYQQNVNLLAESLCRNNHNNNTNDTASSFVEAQEHVGKIVHMKHSIQDWLVTKDWDDVNMMVDENSSNTNSSSSSATPRRRSSAFRSIVRPIVLEPNFDLEVQIDDALSAILATARAAQMESSKAGDWCPHHRRRFKEAELQQQYNKPGNRRHAHSSLQNSNSVLSEKGTRCVAQFYRRDYEIIRQLSSRQHSSTTCKETCRLALESIWNRRSPLLVLDLP
jgi:Sulfotransferase family